MPFQFDYVYYYFWHTSYSPFHQPGVKTPPVLDSRSLDFMIRFLIYFMFCITNIYLFLVCPRHVHNLLLVLDLDWCNTETVSLDVLSTLFGSVFTV